MGKAGCLKAFPNTESTQVGWLSLIPTTPYGSLALSAELGRETVQYVSNIYKYYLAYKMIAEERESREKAKEALKGRLPSSKEVTYAVPLQGRAREKPNYSRDSSFLWN